MLMLSVLAIAQSAFASVPDATFDGQCLYPPGLGAPAPLEARATCDRVRADGDGVEFMDSQWPDKRLRFVGEWSEGERMVVRAVVPRNGEMVEARGLCRIYRANDEPELASARRVPSQSRVPVRVSTSFARA